jgi:hypothetical protein
MLCLSKAQQPYWATPRHFWDCETILSYIHHTRLDFSRLVVGSSQRLLPDNTLHLQVTDVYAPGGIRTHNTSTRTAADPHLRPRRHIDRLIMSKTLVILCYRSVVIEEHNVSHWGYENSIHTSIRVGRGINPLRLIIACLFMERRCLTLKVSSPNPRKSELTGILEYFKSFQLVFQAPAFLLSCVQYDEVNYKYTFDIKVKTSCTFSAALFILGSVPKQGLRQYNLRKTYLVINFLHIP